MQTEYSDVPDAAASKIEMLTHQSISKLENHEMLDTLVSLLSVKEVNRGI
jgi:hypothetical protein